MSSKGLKYGFISLKQGPIEEAEIDDSAPISGGIYSICSISFVEGKTTSNFTGSYTLFSVDYQHKELYPDFSSFH